MPDTASLEPKPKCLQCMEIWGGNEAINDALAVPGLNAWVLSQPYGGGEQGGDIHYISTCGAGKISRFAIADVAGHGADVGDLSARLRKLMRRNINKLDQTRFARALNRGFGELSKEGRFATAILTSYHAPSNHLLVCNAGHPRPLWYQARKRHWVFLDHDLPDRAIAMHNLPLGIISPTNYYQFAVQLELGDLVLLYSDWLPEAANPDHRQLGDPGVLDLVNRLDASAPSQFNHDLVRAVADYCGNETLQDDQTLLLLHHNNADPPRITAGARLRVLGKMFGVFKV